MERDAMVDARYICWRENRRNGMPAAALARMYPRHRAFERMYQDETAVARAAVADGAGIAHLLRHHAMSYGDAARFIAEFK